jgi:hypothetical protein
LHGLKIINFRWEVHSELRFRFLNAFQGFLRFTQILVYQLFHRHKFNRKNLCSQ